MVVFLVKIEVEFETLDALCEDGDLDLWGSGVFLVLGKIGHDRLFLLSLHRRYFVRDNTTHNPKIPESVCAYMVWKNLKKANI